MSHTIPLQAVRDALMLAIVKRKSPVSVARFAAYTRYPDPSEPSCADWRRAPGPDTLKPWHFGTMRRGNLARVLHRHRAETGLAGVRRTWGAGMRELQAEFSQEAMR